MSLDKKEVPEEMEQKVFAFAQTKERFSTKEVFEKFPNNPEFLLRYALNNLRIDNKICMYGNKRGAYYSTNFNLTQTTQEADQPKSNNSDLKQRILDLAGQQNGWFSRTDLKIDDVSVPVVLATIKQLIEEQKLETEGALRWTTYRLIGNTNNQKINKPSGDQLSKDILEFIKRKKVVTVPMIIEELAVPRYDIMDVLHRLCEEEEIYHEGVKKSSKYIYKTVSINEVDSLTSQLNEERKLDQRIDELSNFLISDESTAVSIGMNSDEVLQIKFLKNGSTSDMLKFSDVKEGLKHIYNMTEVKNG